MVQDAETFRVYCASEIHDHCAPDGMAPNRPARPAQFWPRGVNPTWEFSKISGMLFRGLCNKDPTI